MALTEKTLNKERVRIITTLAALRCNDAAIRSRFYSQLSYCDRGNDVNLKLSTIHLLLIHTGLRFSELEQFLFEETEVSEEFMDVGNFPEFTPKDLLNLLRLMDVPLEGCLANLAFNADRTRNITLNYLIAARDALGFGSITEVLWHLRKLKSGSG